MRPPTRLLFISKVIYGHGEPWWNNVGRGKLLICQPELSDNRASSHLVVKQKKLTEEINFAFSASTCSLKRHKILRYGADGFTSPSKDVELRILIALEIHRPGPYLNPRTYVTETTKEEKQNCYHL
jgi:hypothetical protein